MLYILYMLLCLDQNQLLSWILNFCIGCERVFVKQMENKEEGRREHSVYRSDGKTEKHGLSVLQSLHNKQLLTSLDDDHRKHYNYHSVL